MITLGQATRKRRETTTVRQSGSPGFAQPASLAGRVKQTRQRTLTKNPHNFPRFRTHLVWKTLLIWSPMPKRGYQAAALPIGGGGALRGCFSGFFIEEKGRYVPVLVMPRPFLLAYTLIGLEGWKISRSRTTWVL